MTVISKPKDARVVGQVYEGEWFRVDAKSLYRSDFKWKRSDPWQEKIRNLILEAFGEMDKMGRRYSTPFYTMIPRKTWQGDLNGYRLQQIAEYHGDRMANWIEQALEWAQRISMGFSWWHLCNMHDAAKWNRVITWKEDSTMAIVGGREGGDFTPPACIHPCGDCTKVTIMCAVPLVVNFSAQHPDAA